MNNILDILVEQNNINPLIVETIEISTPTVEEIIEQEINILTLE